MKSSKRMTIQQATKGYVSWLAAQIELVSDDLALKHEHMREAPFLFLRATYYRWAQLFPELAKGLSNAPKVLAVGDLHVENFGTWRDAEGRLVWGINDFDEATRLPYVHDLVRLATSAHLAIEGSRLRVGKKEACEAIAGGYKDGLEAGGLPFVLAERGGALREMALHRLKDPHAFWGRMDALPDFAGEVPPSARKALADMWPDPDLPMRIAHRVAGLGSLGRQRFVALADWKGGRIAREAKALAPSAAVWAHAAEGLTRINYQTILDKSVRSVDPWVKLKRRWIVRRLAPDCSRIELVDLPGEVDAVRLLQAMGWETANVHLGSRSAHALLVDLAVRDPGWLHAAAGRMLEAVLEEWEFWRRTFKAEKAEKKSDGGKVVELASKRREEAKAEAKAKAGDKTKAKDGKARSGDKARAKTAKVKTAKVKTAKAKNAKAKNAKAKNAKDKVGADAEVKGGKGKTKGAKDGKASRRAAESPGQIPATPPTKVRKRKSTVRAKSKSKPKSKSGKPAQAAATASAESAVESAAGAASPSAIGMETASPLEGGGETAAPAPASTPSEDSDRSPEATQAQSTVAAGQE
ncbi:MAG TPA: DUF2252 family protein [Thermoanaerobaculia bacterium]|nr:DUF2252 family protein [Thermoanaerobaculia bacterium]